MEWRSRERLFCIVYVCIVCVCTKAQRLINKTKALRSTGCVCYLQRCEEWSVDGETESHNWEWLGGRRMAYGYVGYKMLEGKSCSKAEARRRGAKAAQQVQLKLEWHFENAEPYFHGFNVDLAVFHWHFKWQAHTIQVSGHASNLSTFLSTD